MISKWIEKIIILLFYNDPNYFSYPLSAAEKPSSIFVRMCIPLFGSKTFNIARDPK